MNEVPSQKKVSKFFNFFKGYTQAEQAAIVNARNEAAAIEITKIKRNTQAQLGKLVRN